MVIRCERCSTLYELDEGVLSPSGSQVQCTRCQHVFTAHPPASAGRTLVGVPPQPEARPAEMRAGASASSQRAPAAAPRAVRSGPPQVYRPTTATPGVAAPPGGVRAPLLRKDTVGAFESRLRWSARWRWLGPVMLGLVLVAAGAAWFVLSRRSDPAMARARTEALGLVALDDAESLEEAVARLDGLVQCAPKQAAFAADRSLAQALRAAAVLEEGEALATRLSALAAERDRIRREQRPGWEEAEQQAAARVQALERQVREREEAARALGSAAFETLRTLQTAEAGGAEIPRALAAYYALGGDRERAQRAIRAGSERVPADPWLVLADAWLDARGPERAARERALVKLGSLAVAHPELLRVRYLLARTQAALGRRAEALATLEGLLGANPRHEGGVRLKEELSGAPAAPAPEAPKAEPPPPLKRPAAVAPDVTAEPEPEPAPLPRIAPAPAPRPVVRERPPSAPAGVSGAAVEQAPEAPAAIKSEPGAEGGPASATAPPAAPARPARRPTIEPPQPTDGG